jgi:outer membrane protein OmpA-like peptidoglycan-associated protein
MKLKLFALLIIALPVATQAQLGGKLFNKVKNKVDQRVDRKVDAQIDKSLDEIEGKEQKQSTQQPETASAQPAPDTKPADPGLKSFAKYDFVPGEVVIYSNDFATDNMGELPTGWNTSGNGVVSTINSLKGNWLQLYQNAAFLSDNTAAFSENFTVEFDLVLRRANPKAAFPMLGFGVMATADLSTTDNSLVRDPKKFFALDLKLQPGDYNGSHMHLETYNKNNRYLGTDIKQYPKLQNYFNQVVHIAMQVQKERLRVWFNEDKMYDLPKAFIADTILNQIYFYVKSSNARDEETGYSIGNFKIAKGLPDTRHKLVDEGKFSTTGILFDINSANIKPESTGVLRELADVLTKFPEIKVLIVGHTDSDGNDASNLELSKKRAEAVKQALSKDYNIDATRLSSDGKGEKEPAGDNKTKAGKAQNRRVEFIKV